MVFHQIVHPQGCWEVGELRSVDGVDHGGDLRVVLGATVEIGVGKELKFRCAAWWCSWWCCCGDLGHASRVRFFIDWLFYVRLKIDYLLVV